MINPCNEVVLPPLSELDLMASKLIFNVAETAHITKTKQELKNLITNGEAFVSQHTIRDPKTDEYILDKRTLERGGLNTIVVAGGVISSLLLGMKINDIDVFILAYDGAVDWQLAESLIHRKNGKWTVRYNDDDYLKNEHIHMTAFNHISRVQYILTDYETRTEMLKHFDYVHCMASYHKDTLYITPETYKAIMNKHLVVNGKNQPIPNRTQKFLNAGWKSPAQVLDEAPTQTLSDILAENLKNVKNVNKSWISTQYQNDAFSDPFLDEFNGDFVVSK
jgi:hypothetical protein